jgi:hypothetical protein
MNRRPEPGSEPRWWSSIGCVLPRSIREGVYEPAYLDLWRAVSLGRKGPRGPLRALTGVRVIGYLMASIFYAAPRYFRGWGRSPLMRWTTRIAVAVVAFVALVALLAPWIMLRLGYAY